MRSAVAAAFQHGRPATSSSTGSSNRSPPRRRDPGRRNRPTSQSSKLEVSPSTSVTWVALPIQRSPPTFTSIRLSDSIRHRSGSSHRTSMCSSVVSPIGPPNPKWETVVPLRWAISSIARRVRSWWVHFHSDPLSDRTPTGAASISSKRSPIRPMQMRIGRKSKAASHSLPGGGRLLPNRFIAVVEK